MTHKRLEKLEVIREFSVLYMLFSHVPPQKIYSFGLNMRTLLWFGYQTVILFFVLSYFLSHSIKKLILW